VSIKASSTLNQVEKSHFKMQKKKKNSANIIQQSIRGLIQHPRIINNQTQQQHQE